MPIIGARSLIPLAFYLAVTVVGVTYGEQQRVNKDGGESYSERQVHTGPTYDAYTRGHIQWHRLQSGPGLQHRSTEYDAGLNPLPTRRLGLKTMGHIQGRK